MNGEVPSFPKFQPNVVLEPRNFLTNISLRGEYLLWLDKAESEAIGEEYPYWEVKLGMHDSWCREIDAWLSGYPLRSDIIIPLSEVSLDGNGSDSFEDTSDGDSDLDSFCSLKHNHLNTPCPGTLRTVARDCVGIGASGDTNLLGKGERKGSRVIQETCRYLSNRVQLVARGAMRSLADTLLFLLQFALSRGAASSNCELTELRMCGLKAREGPCPPPLSGASVSEQSGAAVTPRKGGSESVGDSPQRLTLPQSLSDNLTIPVGLGDLVFSIETKGERPSDRHSTWVIDCGATKHCVPSESMCSHIIARPNERYVRVANGYRLRVTAIGTVRIKVHSSHGARTMCLSEVLVIPGLKANLFSCKMGWQVDQIKTHLNSIECLELPCGARVPFERCQEHGATKHSESTIVSEV